MKRNGTSYPNLRAWVDAEYKRVNLGKKNYDIGTLTYTGKIVKNAHPTSPAGLLGVQADDILFEVNGGAFDDEDFEKTFKPRFMGRSHSFKFFRPSTREALMIKGAQFPYGMGLKKTVSSYAAELTSGDPNFDEIETLWETGGKAALAELWLPFEVLIIRLRDLDGSPFDRPLPDSIDPNSLFPTAEYIWPGNLCWLALCAACAGQIERAKFIQEYVDLYFEESGSNHMSIAFAAMDYTHSVLEEARFNQSMAVTYINNAIKRCPQNEQLRRRLEELTGSYTPPAGSAFLGMTPEYTLPRHDPKAMFDQPSGEVSLSHTISNLSKGEFLLLTVMAPYRVNGPYYEGFTHALPALSKLDMFKEVHIVTSWEGHRDKDLHWPAMEPILQKAGLHVSLLFDKDQVFTDTLPITGAPTNLFLDHTGTVIAEGWLEGDAIWETLSKL